MEKIEENISKNLKLFGTKKSKLIDRQISNIETPSFVFMMRAANAAKNFLLMRNVKNATIFVGKGNNGEDGFCLAALLKIENIPVEIIDLSYKDRIKTKSFKLCADLGVVRKKFGLDKIKNTEETFLFTYRGTPSDGWVKTFFKQHGIEYAHIGNTAHVPKKEIRCHKLWPEFASGKPMPLK